VVSFKCCKWFRRWRVLPQAFTERHAELGEEFAAFVIRFGGSDENQVKANLAFHLVEFDFWEDGLVGETAGIIATAVK